MKKNDEHKKDEEGTTGEGKGGREGEIRFKYKDAASLGPRDDMLSATEIKRLLIVHNDLHKERVKKQNLTRKERLALKEHKGKLAAHHQQGMTRGTGASRYLNRPGLSDKAQFSGIDEQVKGLPNEFNDEVNLEMREKLENRFVHRQTPKFHPKPRPRG